MGRRWASSHFFLGLVEIALGVLALASIFAAVGTAVLVSRVQPLNFYYYEMIILMGLAVGIDYSLFIINRYREERAAGRPKMDAIQVASNTTGRAVFYAGVAVVTSLAGLLLTGDALFIGLGLGAMIVVIFPQTLYGVMETLKIERTVDFLVLSGFMFFGVVIFYLYNAVKQMQRKMEKLVRKVAIDKVKEGKE